MQDGPRLRVDEQQLAVACAVLTAPRHALLDRADARLALEGLRRAGVLDGDGALVEPAATLVRVVARPAVRAEARVWRDEAVEELRAWADERDAVLGTLDGGAVELRGVAWERLPAALAERLGLLAPAARPPRRDRLVVAPAALEEARTRVRRDDAPGALEVLRGHGLAGRAAGEALALAEAIRGAVAVTVAWREPDGEAHTGSLVALDAGPLGWWEVKPGASGGELRPSDPDTLARRVVELLP